MGGQVDEGDVSALPARRPDARREEALERVVEAHLTLGNHVGEEEGGEQLCDRPDVEHAVAGNRPAAHDELAVFRHHAHDHAHDTVAHEAEEPFAGRGRELLLAQGIRLAGR